MHETLPTPLSRFGSADTPCLEIGGTEVDVSLESRVRTAGQVVVLGYQSEPNPLGYGRLMVERAVQLVHCRPRHPCPGACSRRRVELALVDEGHTGRVADAANRLDLQAALGHGLRRAHGGPLEVERDV